MCKSGILTGKMYDTWASMEYYELKKKPDKPEWTFLVLFN